MKQDNQEFAEKLERLRTLADTPDEQVAYARRLLDKDRTLDVVLAAITVLGEREDPRLRPAILRAYAYYDGNGVRRDPGGPIRKALLNALRPIILPEDVALCERAVATYEFLFGEEGGDLRAAGLLALNVADATLGGYHAVRLLTDPYTSSMSGEPAVTAVKVLATQSQYLSLYAYLMHDGTQMPDVVAECLRSLTGIPASILGAVYEKYKDSTNEIVLLGLIDLLLGHAARADYLDFIYRFLRETTLYNIYRYVLIVLINLHDRDILRELDDLMERERDRAKRDIWQDVSELRR